MARTTVSVIIPVYNGAQYLSEAMTSALEQSYPPSEIVVVDDGSTDETAAIAASFGPQVCLVSQENQGLSAARNRGAASASGEWLAFLDHDDIWLPNKLALQLAAASSPDIAIVYGGVEQFVSPEVDESTRQRLYPPAGIIVAPLPSALLVRRAAFERIGPFSLQRQTGEMIDWYARAIDAGLRSVAVPECIVRRRIHGSNLSLREHPQQRDFPRVLKAVLDRRRQSSGGEAAPFEAR